MTERNDNFHEFSEVLIIRGVAVVLMLPDGRVYTVEETTSRPNYGKMPGMRTIPMETLNEDELPKEGLKRLLFSGKEEIASGMIEVKEVEEIGVYTLNIAAVSLYKVKCELLDELIAPPDSEVINPLWMLPEELLVNWVRMGAEREVARQELSFRDKFLSEAGLESVVESADIVVDNKDDIEISVRYLSSELERQYNLKL